jgi:hypothetical protein
MLSRTQSKPLYFYLPKLALLATTIVVGGCGSSTTKTAEGKPGNQAERVATVASPEDVSTASNVVAQFLDAVRRGGENGSANQLLTLQAQTVLQRLGQTVQPIGSPDAIFKVTRAESVPDTPGAALVHSVWTEPTGPGTSESYEVVWALLKETAGWRISGLAMDLQPGQEPMIVDFENASQMAVLLNSSEEATAGNSTGGGTVSQATGNGVPFQR